MEKHMYGYKIQNIKNGHEANVLKYIFIEFLTFPKNIRKTKENMLWNNFIQVSNLSCD
jgi:hypothetical protein